MPLITYNDLDTFMGGFAFFLKIIKQARDGGCIEAIKN